jgi:hypothetical protein
LGVLADAPRGWLPSDGRRAQASNPKALRSRFLTPSFRLSPGPDRQLTPAFNIAWPGQRPDGGELLRSHRPGSRLPRPCQTAFMIADAVRYMSVHSWKQPDSGGRSGTLPWGNSSAREPETSQLTGHFRR